MVGLKKIKSWVILLSLSKLDDKPQELTSVALVRAKTCELLSHKIKGQDPENFFTVGMLSCLPAFMDMTMPELVKRLPISNDIHDALLYYKGFAGFTLATVMAHEYGWWEKINWNSLSKMGIKDQDLNEYYREAVNWSNEFTKIN
jgi:EAL and modified HD-GYP domain-containing signal transduction protein